MSIAEFLNDPKPAAPSRPPDASESAKLRKQVLVGFGSIAVLGLALTGSYVASRIIAGTQTSPRIAAAAAPVVKPAVQIAEPAVTPDASAPASRLATTTPAPPPPMVPVPTVLKPVPVAEPRPLPAAKAPAPATKQSAPAPVVAKPVPTQAPVASTKRDGQFQRHDLNPQRGEKYLQIAAYGPRSLDAYLKAIERQGFHPLVAPGPAENIYRVVIGPFPDSNALEQARRSIQAEGIEPILRSY